MHNLQFISFQGRVEPDLTLSRLQVEAFVSIFGNLAFDDDSLPQADFLARDELFDRRSECWQHFLLLLLLKVCERNWLVQVVLRQDDVSLVCHHSLQVCVRDLSLREFVASEALQASLPLEVRDRLPVHGGG